MEDLIGVLVDGLKPHGGCANLGLVFSWMFLLMFGINFGEILAL